MTRAVGKSAVAQSHLVRALITALMAVGALIASPATAQVANGTPPAVISPLSSEPDLNRVNIANGRIRLDIPTLTIPASPRLKLDTLQNAMPYITARVSGGGGNYIESSVSVHFGQETSDGFSCLFDDVCTNRKGQGSVLDGDITNGGPYTVTQGGSGAVFTFDRLSFDTNVNGTRQTIYYASSVVYPDGETISYTYDTAPLGSRTIYRVTRINSSTGFHIQFSYQGSDPNLTAWLTVAQSTIYRTSAPTMPIERLTYSSAATITDLAGRVYGCSGCDFRVGGQIELFSAAVTLPGEATPTQTVSSAIFGIVTSVVRDGVTWNYAYTNYRAINSPEGYGYDKVTVTGPNGFNTAYNILAGSQQRPNQITSTVDALGRTTAYIYDPSQRITRITSPEGNSTSIGYDKWGNIIAKTVLPKPGSGAAVLNESSAIDSAACALNQVLCYRIITYTDALGRVTNYSYDGAGRLIEQTDPADASGVRRKTYNSYGAGGYSPILVRICGTGAPCGSNAEIRTEYTYWNGTQLPLTETRVDVGRGISATTTYAYDPAGRVLSVDGPLPGTDDATYNRYDVAGRRTWEIGPKGQIGLRKATRTIYRDSDDKAVMVEVGTLPDATSTALSVSERMDITYDSRRNAIRTIRSSGGVTYAVLDKSVDDRGRTDCETVRMNLAALPAASATAACSLGSAGGQGADRITKRIYDVASQLTKTQVAVGTTVAADDETNTYSPNGKLATVTDGENNRTTYEYDGHDRLTSTRYPVPAVGALASSTTDFEQLSYDAVGNIISRRLRDGNSIAYTYDNLDRRTSLNKSPCCGYFNPNQTFSYDVQGLIIAAVDQYGHHASNSYDALGRKLTEANYFGHMTAEYDVAGRRTRLTWHDGFYVTYDYDAVGSMTAIREYGAASGVGVLATYNYDGLGRRTAITRGNASVTRYEYDPVDRLTGLQHDFAGTTSDVTYGRVGGIGASISHSPANQITAFSRDNDSYRWFGHYNVNRAYGTNGLNQLTSSGGTALGYDGRGNLTSSGGQGYSYDSLNQLSTAPGVTYLYYDPAGRLDQVYLPSGTWTNLLYDGSNLTTEYQNNTLTILRRYVHGPGQDEPVVWYEGAGTSDRRWLHADERGSIIAISNSVNSVIQINSYDEYGIPASTNIGRFQYTGQTWLSEIGLYYYKARIYSPTLGRFMQTDPIGYKDGINWYDYVDGDPVNSVDPDGQAVQAIGGAIIGAGLEIAIQLAFEQRSIGNLDGNRILISAASGAIGAGLATKAGQLGGTAARAVGRVVAAAVAGAASNAANDVAAGKNVSASSVAKGAILGAAGAKAGAATERAFKGGLRVAAERTGKFIANSRGAVATPTATSGREAFRRGAAEGAGAAAGASVENSSRMKMQCTGSLIERTSCN